MNGRLAFWDQLPERFARLADQDVGSDAKAKFIDAIQARIDTARSKVARTSRHP